MATQDAQRSLMERLAEASASALLKEAAQARVAELQEAIAGLQQRARQLMEKMQEER